MSIQGIARPEIRDLVPYDAKPLDAAFTRLNANEAPVNPYNSALSEPVNRYPELRPRSLQIAMADLFGVRAPVLCPTRGSSEGIDLLIRCFCRAYQDNVVILPPTFEMYASYATMQAADIRRVPLLAKQGFAVDWQTLEKQCDGNTKIVFLCSPNNPTGNLIPQTEILEFAKSRDGKSLVVIDEAYLEFSDQQSLAHEIDNHGNLVVLRTLSKAYALAGARCGAVIASEPVVNILSALSSPYSISAPVTNVVLAALQPDNRAAAVQQIKDTIQQRDRVSERLATFEVVDHVWPSSANFLLVRFAFPDAAKESLAEQQVAIREFSDDDPLRNCARITIGTPGENDRLIAALGACSKSLS